MTIGDDASIDRALAFEEGDALFDARHRFVVSFSAELPTPKDMGAVIEHLAGGWQLNGIVQAQTGISDDGLRPIAQHSLSDEQA